MAKHESRELFARSLKVVSGLLTTLEKRMKASKGSTSIDSEDIKAAKELGALVNQMAKTQEAFNRKAMVAVSEMSQAQQFDVCVAWLQSLPAGYRAQAHEKLAPAKSPLRRPAKKKAAKKKTATRKKKVAKKKAKKVKT